jgi:hypothetical protein
MNIRGDGVGRREQGNIPGQIRETVVLLCEALETTREDVAFIALRLFAERGPPIAIRSDPVGSRDRGTGEVPFLQMMYVLRPRVVAACSH